jgi:hypothetical protein
MKTLKRIDITISSLSNLVFFAGMLTAFILIFFYPEVAGSIMGKIVKSINTVLQSK